MKIIANTALRESKCMTYLNISIDMAEIFRNLKSKLIQWELTLCLICAYFMGFFKVVVLT